MPQEILIVPHHGREKLALSVGTFIESETGRKDGVGQFSVKITRLIISEKSPTLYGWPIISCMLKMLHRIYVVVTNSFKSLKFEPTIGVRGGVNHRSTPPGGHFLTPTPVEHFRPPQASRWFQGLRPHIRVPSK